MRHAPILAATVSGLLITSAGAAPGIVSGEVFVKLPGAASNGGGRIEVESFVWGGTSGTVAYKLKPVFVKSWSTSGDAGSSPPRGAGSNQISMDDTAGKEREEGFRGRGLDIASVDGQTVSPSRGPARTDMVLKGKTIDQNSKDPAGFGEWVADVERPAARGTVGASQTLTVGGARTESQRPLQKGSVWVRVSSPWAACRVGTRYPSLELGGGEITYALSGVTISSCGSAASPHEVAFNYQAIRFSD